MKYIRSYWQWTMSGSLWKKLVGFGVVAFAALIVLAAIFGSSEEETPESTSTQPSPTAASSVGVDASPTTESVDQSSQPTATLDPVATAEPTATPEPTSTPEPTATLEPVVLQGFGDDVVEVAPGPALLVVQGNAESRHFAIEGRNAAGGYTDLYVNTTDPYSGTVALDFFGDETTRLVITAADAWTIEIRPITAARVANVPGSISGTGDDVLLLFGNPDTAVVTGNEEGRHFSVQAFGDGYDLLVNTTDPYDGRVLVAGDTLMLAVSAEGAWEITFE